MARFAWDRTSLAILGVASLMWFAGIAYVGLQIIMPSDGARLQPGIQSPGGLGLAPLLPNGLQAGDILIAVNGQNISGWAQTLSDFAAPTPDWTFGETITYTVQRNGQTINAPITLGHYPLGAILAAEWGSIIFALVNQLVMAFVFFKRPNESITRALFFGSAGMVSATTWSFGLQVADLVNRPGFWLYALTTVGAYMFVWVSALHAALIFPVRWSPLERQRWIIPFLYATPFVIFAIATWAAPERAALDWLNQNGRITSALQLAYIVLTMAAAVRGYRAARDPISRLQVRWITAAFLITFFCAITFGMIPELVVGYPLVSWSGLALIGLLVPFAFAVAILRYRLFDIDVILNRTLVYGTLTLIVISLYVGAVGALGELFQTSNTFAPILLTTVAVVAVFRPLRALVQGGVDRLTTSRGRAEKQTPVKQDAARAHDIDAPRDDQPVTPVRLSPLDYLFRGLAIVGVLEIIAFAATLSAQPNAPGVLGQGLYLRIWLGLIAAPAILLVGGLIVWRVPGNAVGRFLILIALGGIAAQFDLDLGAPTPSALAVEAIVLFDAGLVGPSLGYLMLTFPTGRVYPPHWTRAVILAAIVKFLGVVLEILASPGRIKIFAPTINPLFVPVLAPYQPIIAVTIGITGLLLPLILVAGLISLVLRYRAAPAPERQQIKWVMWGFGLLVPVGVTTFGLIFRYGFANVPFQITSVFAASAQILFLASIAIAILRYHLFDIDILINRTLVYGSLTLVIVGIYVLAVGTLSELAHESGSVILSLLATGLIAVFFQPLRERLQRAVNRFMYGDRDDPYAVLSRLGQRLETTLAPDAVLPTIVETVTQTLKLPYAAITLQEADSDKVAAAFGLPVAHTLAFPLIHQHDLIGHLHAAQRSPDEPFTPVERRLLEDIARQIGVAAHNVRLTADLQRSRERLVTTREEERRRIRRDLHDGLGPTLASHSYRLDAVLDLIDQNPDAAKKLIADLKAQTQTTLADIRRLVYELRPPALDELGLIAALQAQWVAQNGLQVSIESLPEGLPPLTAAVEVAAYRIAMEAVNNAARHAKARNCVVRFTAKEKEMVVEIRDDGGGIPDGARSGVGLASMKERAAELGGVCVIESLPRRGTKVVARLPFSR